MRRALNPKVTGSRPVSPTTTLTSWPRSQARDCNPRSDRCDSGARLHPSVAKPSIAPTSGVGDRGSEARHSDHFTLARRRRHRPGGFEPLSTEGLDTSRANHSSSRRKTGIRLLGEQEKASATLADSTISVMRHFVSVARPRQGAGVLLVTPSRSASPLYGAVNPPCRGPGTGADSDHFAGMAER